MPIRLSGLSSGLDTEALVSALMSSYNLKKDNLVKAQTKLSWKQDSWKTMNTSIYSFYTGALNNAKLSKTYNSKSTTISDSAYAKVSADSTAVNGTQSLKINSLAATGYLTGGQIAIQATGISGPISSSTKLSSLVATGTEDSIFGGGVSVAVDGKTTSFQITKDMTIGELVSKYKSAGLDANFDANNNRIFLSSPTSGQDHDFTMIATDEKGISSLKALGLYTVNDTDRAQYEMWSAYDEDTLKSMRDTQFAEESARLYKDANTTLSALNAENGSKESVETLKNQYKTDLETQFAAYSSVDEHGETVYDETAIEEAGQKTLYDRLQTNISRLTTVVQKYEDAQTTIDHTASRVKIDGDGNVTALTSSDAAYDAEILNPSDSWGINRRDAILTGLEATKSAAQTALTTASSDGAVRIIGKDAVIELNGAEFTNNTNNFTINGLTIQAQAETGSANVSITTETDIDGVYKSIKSFLTEYNKLITSMDTAYNASSSKGYEPLTSDEKKAMTDDEVKEWEKKIKDSLLRKDSILGNTASSMKTDMLKSYVINGKTYSLSTFGIGTLGYFTSDANEKGVMHINGDKDDTDSDTREKADKLRAAITNDPEGVSAFFSKLATDMYTDLTKRMGSTSMSSIYKIYNDKQMATEYSEYKTKIKDQEAKISTWETYYYNKFSKMECALAKLNSNSSSLSNLLSN